MLFLLKVASFLTFCNTISLNSSSIGPYLAPLDLQQALDPLFTNQVFKQAFLMKDKQTLVSFGCTLYPTRWGNIIFEHAALPGYIIKGEKPYQNRNWKRVFFAQKIKDAIKNNVHFAVVEEYLYYYPGHSTLLHSDNYCVISKKIAFKNIPLAIYLSENPPLLKELQTIMKKMGYWDLSIRKNVFVTHDGKIIFIDTEPYPNDHNFLIQPVLDLIFFRLQKRGCVAAKKLQRLVKKIQRERKKQRSVQ